MVVSCNNAALPVRKPSMKLRARSELSKAEALQLWVEHGTQVSARSTILISKWNAHHAAAVNAQARISIPTADISGANSGVPRFVVVRDASQRHLLRKLRREKRLHIASVEEANKRKAEEERLKRLEALRAAESEAKRKQEAAKQQEKVSKPVQQVAPVVQAVVKAQPPKVLPVKQEAVAAVPTAANSEVPKEDQVAEDIAEIQQVWKQVCEDAEPFRKDYAMKKGRIALKKKVNLAVNQISASMKQVANKIQELCSALVEAKRIGGHSGEAFAMKEICQRLVSEADGSVALSKATGYAVGAVIVGVAANAENVLKMRQVFLGAFYEHCIYTMPTYGRKRAGESQEEFRKRIGYREGEKSEGYMERACGCVSLFAAVIQTEPTYGNNGFSLDDGWKWLARIVNGKQSSITPAIVYAMLETAGYSMSNRYRRQFAKLMAMIQKVVVLGAVKSAPNGPTNRLDAFIEEYVSNGCSISKQPEGRNLPATDAQFV